LLALKARMIPPLATCRADQLFAAAADPILGADTREVDMAAHSKTAGNVVDDIVERIRGYLKPYQALFTLPEQAQHLGHVIVGLTSDLERKSSEPIAVLLGLPRRLIQNFVGLSRWAWEPLRRLQRQEVSAEIGIADGMLIIDESAVPKKGTETVGVARQWCGRLGKVDNCVVGVHAVYVGKDGQTSLVDSQLFLPDSWALDFLRRAKVYVPPEVQAATKVQIGLDMVRRMAEELPFSQVTADEAYGRSTAFRDGVRALQKWYVVEVPCNTLVRTLRGTGSARARRVDEVCKLIKRERPLDRVLVAYGEKEPIYVQAMMQEVSTARRKGRVQETLLYLEVANGEKKFYLAYLPATATLTSAVRMACTRHRIEEVFGEAKGEVGMDHFECRAWHGWHHHMTLVQVSHWFLIREQRRLGKKMSRHLHQSCPPSSGQTYRPALDTDANPRLAQLQPHPQREVPHRPLPSQRLRAPSASLAARVEAA